MKFSKSEQALFKQALESYVKRRRNAPRKDGEERVSIPEEEYTRLIRCANAVGECLPTEVPQHVYDNFAGVRPVRNLRHEINLLRDLWELVEDGNVEVSIKVERIFEEIRNTLKRDENARRDGQSSGV